MLNRWMRNRVDFLILLVLLLVRSVSFAQGTVDYVQGNYATPPQSSHAVSVTFTGAQAAGDLNVVVVGWDDSKATVRAVTDTRGNLYTLAVGPTIQSGVASQSIYYAKNILAASAGANTVTVTFSKAARAVDIRILEYNGADLNNPVDVTAAASGSSETSSSGSATTTNATDLIFGANMVQTLTTAPGSGFTTRLLTTPNGNIAEDRMVTSAGSYSASASINSGQWIMQMVAFRAAGLVPDTTAPAVTINQAAGQADPTAASLINFTVVFSEEVTGFSNTDITLGGTAGATTAVVTGSGPTYNVAVSGMTGPGTVTPTIGAGTVTDLAGNPNTASTSTDNTVTYNTDTTAPATITYVQGNYATPQSSQSVVSVTFTGAQAAGDLNVVVVGWNDSTATVSAVTDTRGNLYTLAVGPTIQSGVASQSIYYAKNIVAASAGANTVTVTFSAAARAADIRILEYNGADLNNPVDVTAAASGSSETSSSGSATTTNATDLIFGANLVQTLTTAPGSGFTTRLLTTPDGDIAEDQMVTSTGSYSASASISSGQWIMQMVAFRTGPSVVDTEAPGAPTNLTATAISGQIQLNWTASVDNIGVHSYLIERCQGTGCVSFAQIDTTTAVTYSDTALAADTAYSYRLRASDNAGNISSYSNVATATSGLAISPRVATLTFTRTQQFTAGNGVTWFVDGVQGGTAASGTITAAGLYTPPGTAGTHTVTVVSPSQSSADATVYVVNYPGTFTRDVDNIRTGLNPNETVLTPAMVNAANFGKLFSYSIDGVSDASPLYVANVNIPGKGYHNVVYVATEHDSVYAFDADGLQTDPLWHVSFIDPNNGVTTVPPGDTGEDLDISPEIGITGSPVIDPATNTLYVVAKTREVQGGHADYFHRLHALDITTGVDRLPAVIVQGSVPGKGDGASGNRVPFLSLRENQRAALLLSNGVVYFAFASHGDNPPYHGWVFGYRADTLKQVLVYNTTPDGEGGGIWQSGDGLATDSTGNLFFVTGDGTFDANANGSDYGDSFVKLSPSGTVLDYFTPHDQSAMNAGDIDLGSGGTILIPDQGGPHPHLALSAGKNGTIYVVDRDNMGHYNAQNDNQIVQSLTNIFPGGTFTTGNFKAPVYWNGNLYFSADADYIKSFRMTNGLMSTTPTSYSSFIVNYPGATLGLSSNGNTNAILWAIQRVDLDPLGQFGDRGPGVLHAFDAQNLAIELYNSAQAAGGRDELDFAAKWAAPLVANGRVFVATNGRLTAFGLLP
jgi:hypothetical protein